MELVIVVLIVAILAAVSAPRWLEALRGFRVSNAASRIAADLARAKSVAYSSSTSKRVIFRVPSNQYEVEGVPPLDRRWGANIVVLTNPPYQSTLVSVWGQTGTQTITFDGYGLPDKGGNIVVAAGAAQKTIVVDAITGAAVIQ